MKCSDKDLISRYVDGEVDSDLKDEIESHIQACDSCRKEYESFIAMRSLLTEFWSGKIAGCFDTETLAEYLDGLVDEDTKAKIEEHLTQCEVCASELELMKQIDIAQADETMGMPGEVSERIDKAVMAKRQEVIDSLPLIDLVKKNFTLAAKRFTHSFIARYYESEQPLVESFWKLLSPLYHREARFDGVAFDPSISAAVGDSKSYHAPSIILTMMGICDYLRDSEGELHQGALDQVVRQNGKRFDLSRREQRRLREFLIQEYIKQQRSVR